MTDMNEIDDLKFEGSVKPSPEIVARLIWAMDSEQQAEMLNALYDIAGSEHVLMMQFMACRKDCEKRGDNALAAFQAMFSSAYKHMW